EKGEKKCLCPGGFYFDGTILACVKLPGHNEACVGRCSAQLLCDAKTGTCQCQGDLEYDTATKTCLLREPCRAPLDLLFVVDASGSLGEDNFNKELAFVEKIINSFDVNPQGAKVAMLTFSTRVQKQFCFNEHATKDEVNQTKQ
ncbi:matrilin-4-like, partial [Aplysia californica]|uniref:Matrilin-4-like n=1 Tax=Aplysia californica TaxID=6500 RepID=A0ABM1VU53_APLCA